MCKRILAIAFLLAISFASSADVITSFTIKSTLVDGTEYTYLDVGIRDMSLNNYNAVYLMDGLPDSRVMYAHLYQAYTSNRNILIAFSMCSVGWCNGLYEIRIAI